MFTLTRISGYVFAALLPLVAVTLLHDSAGAQTGQQSAFQTAVDPHFNLSDKLPAATLSMRYYTRITSQKSREISFSEAGFISDENNSNAAEQDTVPHPRDVMIRSLILPGWGQYTNRQIWKIPLVYGLIGGLGAYAWYADTRYKGFRAAFYNSFPENDDLRFGPTPDWISPDSSPEFLRNSRNFFRNRRDFLILATVLAYGLNVIDAYVFAHMRDFDVSDDLSSRRIEVNTSSFRADRSLPIPLVSLNLRF